MKLIHSAAFLSPQHTLLQYTCTPIVYTVQNVLVDASLKGAPADRIPHYLILPSCLFQSINSERLLAGLLALFSSLSQLRLVS